MIYIIVEHISQFYDLIRNTYEMWYFYQAGFPAGVVNIVPGFGVGAGTAITSHHDIDKVGLVQLMM